MGVVDNNIHDFGSRIGDIVKVDGDVVAGPASAFLRLFFGNEARVGRNMVPNSFS